MEEKQWNILTLSEQPERIEAAAAWFHEKWNIPQQVYRESMEQSKECPKKIPQWYIAVGQDGRILGGLGVIENDFQEDFLFIIQKSSIYVNEYSVIIFNLSFLKGVGLTK